MKPRGLIICGDAWHPAETVRRGLAPLCESGFEFEFLADDGKFQAELLPNFSVIMLAKANMISATDERPWLTPDLAATLQNHLRRGNGLVAVHAGTSRYERSSEMRKIIGGTFGRHPAPCAVAIEPKAGHRLAAGVASFIVHDEHYFMTMSDGPTDVFLHSHSEHGVQPAAWTRTEGNGRVCVLTPGHNLEVWLHPEFQKLLLNALRWTAKLN